MDAKAKPIELGAGAARSPTPLVAIASVIVSMALVAVGNGLMFAYIPVRLGADGFAPTWAGGILTGLSAGGIAGCLLTGVLVRRIGHARAYMVLSALIVLSNAGVAAGAHPVLWIAARALYGFAICAMFIVAQSWLNDAVGNSIRGRVMAVFYVSYIVGMGIGSAMMGVLDIGSAQAPLVGIAFTALSMLPIGMTRLAQPPAPEAASVALRRAWQISPVGVAGMLAVGGLSMMIAGFAPIHATAKGFTQQEVATLMFCMPLGTLLFQIPFGWISDRTDRRYVLIAASLLVAVAGVAAARYDAAALTVILVIYVIWSGASEFDLFAVLRPCQRPRLQGRPRGALVLHAVCLVAVGFPRPRPRHGADGRLWHAILHLCGDSDRYRLCAVRGLAGAQGAAGSVRRDRQLCADDGAGPIAGGTWLHVRCTEPPVAGAATGSGAPFWKVTTCCGKGMERPLWSKASFACLVRSILVAR